MSNDGQVTPVPDDFDGPVFPYRGQETHGVPDSGYETIDDDLYAQGRPVEYTEPEREPDPVPVRIVSGDKSRVVKSFRVGRLVAPVGSAAQILPRHENRTTAKVRNMHATDVMYVSDSNSVTALSGYPVPASGEWSTDSTEPVYATSGTANVIEVATVVELEEEQ